MDVNPWFARFDEEAGGIVWEFDDALESLYIVTEDTACDLAWCDWVIAKCKQELEERSKQGT